MNRTLIKFIFFLLLISPTFSGCREFDKNTQGDKPQNENPGLKSFANTDRTVSKDSSYGRPDFVTAARKVTGAVVHIKTRYLESQSMSNDPFDRFYGGSGSRLVLGSGSGVTISSDGYIATNNHVIENATMIEVIFSDRRSYKAKLVGRDPSTDLALLKVDAENLPVVAFGNSDEIQVGEWVLAVGYPLSLNTTVTAGIISAKGRSLGIINTTRQEGFENSSSTIENTAVESFLQTDAAINPGNSGGALVNTRGELVGINTAIATQTGSYAGYAFAIPVNLAIKVLDDLRNFGEVKRGILGVSFAPPALEEQYLQEEGINPGSVTGVYIIDVQAKSAADQSGLQSGDFIQGINNNSISSSAELSELIARHHPGDKISITYLRNGTKYTTEATLKGEVTTSSDQSLAEIYRRLGAVFAPLSADAKESLSINSGVLVKEVKRGGFFDRIGIPSGTIIVVINGRPVNSPSDIEKELLTARRGLIRILAIAPDGSRVAFSFSLGT